MKQPAAILAAVVTACGLVTAAPALGSSPPSPRAQTVPTPDGVQWHGCSFAFGTFGFGAKVQCATLKVPMDHRKPHGRQVTLALSLVRHTSSPKDYQGVMLSNPGGPGASGLDLGGFLANALPGDVGGQYDWVSWDPRGVGASRPTLSCDRGYFKSPRRPYEPTSHRLVRYWLHRSKAYADACQRHNPKLLKNITTLDSVRDMESIRKAVKVHKISFYGYSYGSYLGEVYSTLHPTHLKRMVLDSNVDPRRVWYGANLDQDKAFERTIHAFFRWVAKYHHDYQLGATGRKVAQRYYSTVAALTKHRTPKFGPDEFADAMETAAYERSSWPTLASEWHAYHAKGHTAPLRQEYKYSDDVGNDNEFAVYNAVQCTDAQWPKKWSRWKRDNTRYNKKYPFLTWGNAWYNAPCLFWGAKAHRPVTIEGTATKSLLLVDETLDAATPYAGSLQVRKLYPHSSLIAEPGGTSHANSLSGDDCVDNKIADYLATGNRPPRQPGRGADVECAPIPAPTPASQGGFTSTWRPSPLRR